MAKFSVGLRRKETIVCDVDRLFPGKALDTLVHSRESVSMTLDFSDDAISDMRRTLVCASHDQPQTVISRWFKLFSPLRDIFDVAGVTPEQEFTNEEDAANRDELRITRR